MPRPDRLAARDTTAPEVSGAGADEERVLRLHRALAVAYPDAATAGGRLDPVSELVSTILSQHTSDLNRDRGYERLVARFADWDAVADAPEGAVRDAIRPAGLANQKAPRIQGALRAVRDRAGEMSLEFLRDGDPDAARSWLTGLDGVGVKTASIVMLFALEMPAFPVDTHVHRLALRLELIPDGTTAERAHRLLEASVPDHLYLPFHMELVAHGRAVCRARAPLCDDCPVRALCPWPDRQAA